MQGHSVVLHADTSRKDATASAIPFFSYLLCVSPAYAQRPRGLGAGVFAVYPAMVHLDALAALA
jgi:hypothetical protein